MNSLASNTTEHRGTKELFRNWTHFSVAEYSFVETNQDYYYNSTLLLRKVWHLQTFLENTKGVIIIRTSKKNRQDNGQKKKRKRTKKTIYKTYTYN